MKAAMKFEKDIVVKCPFVTRCQRVAELEEKITLQDGIARENIQLMKRVAVLEGRRRSKSNPRAGG